MGLLTMNSEQLRYKMKNLDELLPNRSVTNDDEFFELYNKFVELIEDKLINYYGFEVLD